MVKIGKLVGLAAIAVVVVCGSATADRADRARNPSVRNWAGDGIYASEQPYVLYPNGSITTKVFVNEKGPFSLIVDTGGFMSGLNRVTISANKLSYKSKGTINVIGADGKGRMRLLEFKSLRIAKNAAKNPLMLELPGPPLGMLSPDKGILGTDILANFTLGFDVSRKYLVFYPRSYDLVERSPGLFDTIPMHRNRRSNGLTARIAFNGKTITALIDTGATRSVIDKRLARRLGLEMLEGHSERGIGINGRTIEAQLATIDTIKAGTKTWSDVRIWVIDMPRGRPRLQAILGMDRLAEGPFAIDYGHERVLLVKTAG